MCAEPRSIDWMVATGIFTLVRTMSHGIASSDSARGGLCDCLNLFSRDRDWDWIDPQHGIRLITG